jgi:integrase
LPSIRRKTTKSGRDYYEITVSRGRSQSRLFSRWYVPEGWSQRAIDRELAKVAAEFERQCKAGEVISRKEKLEREAQETEEAAKIQTVRQYGERVFMPAKTITMSENSRASFQSALNTWIYPAIGEKKLPDVSPADLSALLLDIQAKGRAHATVIKCYTVLHNMFKMAYLADAIPRNPMDKVARPVPRKDEIREITAQALTVDELRAVLKGLEAEPLKWRALVHLLIDTGMRRGEACGLQWTDVDLEVHVVTIRRNLCYTPQRGVYLDTPKSGKVRDVDFGPETASLLEALRGQSIGEYVFTKDNGEPMHPQSPTRYLKKFSRRFGFPDLHPHKLRHTFASIAITAGADVASVSEALGHSDKAVTLRMYTHADAESRRRAAHIFQEAIKKTGQDT